MKLEPVRRVEDFADISANGAPINDLVGVPVGTMTYSLLAFATARLSTEVDLLAIGDLIVHLLTVSFEYVPKH